MYVRKVLAVAALAVGVSAQLVTNSFNGVSISVNIPDSTSSSGSGSIYLQVVAPSGLTWFGVGQGTSMSGANMFVLYSQSGSNVTVSPRLGTGHQEPQYNSDAQISLLDGTEIDSSGNMIANIRCDSCLSWSGGSMDPTDSNSNWIWAVKGGDSLDSSDLSEDIRQHDQDGTFNLDLTSGTGGSSTNPFVQAASASASVSAPASTRGSATATNGASSSSTSVVSGPAASSSGSSGFNGVGGFASTTDTTRAAHAAVMSVVFILFFPLFALTLYLPYAKRVRFIHAPLQIVSIILLIVGLALGVKLGNRIGELDGYHQIIGYALIAVLVAFQPALGIYQHMHYSKTGGRSALGVVHQWLGRTVILVGIVNGGLGFMQSGPVGSEYVPNYSVIVYSIAAIIVLLVYLAVVISTKYRRNRHSMQGEKRYGNGYEMHPSSNQRHVPEEPSGYQRQQSSRLPEYQRQQYQPSNNAQATAPGQSNYQINYQNPQSYSRPTYR